MSTSNNRSTTIPNPYASPTTTTATTTLSSTLTQLQKIENGEKAKVVVESVLKNHRHLTHLTPVFVEHIRTLEDNYLYDQVFNLSLSTISSKTKYLQMQKKIDNLNNNNLDHIPRSLRIKVDITTGNKDIMRTDEFRSLLERRDRYTTEFQNNMKQLFHEVKVLEKIAAVKDHRDSVLTELNLIIEMHAFTTISNCPGNVKNLWKENGDYKQLTTCAWLTVFDKDTNKANYLFSDIMKFTESEDRDKFLDDLLKGYDKDSARTLMNTDQYKSLQGVKLFQQTWTTVSFMTTLIRECILNLFESYRVSIEKKDNIALMLATFASKKVKKTTEAVAAAVTEDGTVSKGNMTDYIDKKINESIKNFSGSVQKATTKNTKSRSPNGQQKGNKKRKHQPTKNTKSTSPSKRQQTSTWKNRKSQQGKGNHVGSPKGSGNGNSKRVQKKK